MFSNILEINPPELICKINLPHRPCYINAKLTCLDRRYQVILRAIMHVIDMVVNSLASGARVIWTNIGFQWWWMLHSVEVYIYIYIYIVYISLYYTRAPLIYIGRLTSSRWLLMLWHQMGARPLTTIKLTGLRPQSNMDKQHLSHVTSLNKLLSRQVRKSSTHQFHFYLQVNFPTGITH